MKHHSKKQPFAATAQSHSIHNQNTHLLQRPEGFTQCCQGNCGVLVTASPEAGLDGRSSAGTPAGLQLSQRVAHQAVPPATRWPKRDFPHPVMGINCTSHPTLPRPSFLGRLCGACTTHELSGSAVFQRAGKREKCRPAEFLHRWAEMLMEEKQEDYKKLILHSHSLYLLPFSEVQDRVAVNQKIHAGIPMSSGEQTPTSNKAKIPAAVGSQVGYSRCLSSDDCISCFAEACTWY